MFRKFAFFSLAALALLLSACQAPAATPASETAPTLPPATALPTVEPAPVAAAPHPAENLTEGCIPEGQFDAEVDYFPQKSTLTYTENFSIEYHNSYKVITIQTPWPGATEALTYALVQCGAPAPEGFLEEQVIEVPVKTVVTMSTTYLPFLESYGLLDRLVGLDDATYVSNPAVLKMAEAGKLVSLGYGAGVNVEQALALAPDLVMTYGSGLPEYDAHPVLLQAGLKVAVNAEWMDTSPLGRAEWGKFIAAFFNKEAQAEAIFAQTAQKYEQLKALAAAADPKPSVFTNTDYQGTWSMPGGNSFAAAFLKDAGATYLWAEDTSTGSLPLAFEAVFERAQPADFWLNIGFVPSLEAMQAADARYVEFNAFKTSNVWNNDARVSANGGYDFYESGIANPDLVLADLIKIFHPDLLPDHTLYYYRQVK